MGLRFGLAKKLNAITPPNIFLLDQINITEPDLNKINFNTIENGLINTIRLVDPMEDIDSIELIQQGHEFDEINQLIPETVCQKVTFNRMEIPSMTGTELIKSLPQIELTHTFELPEITEIFEIFAARFSETEIITLFEPLFQPSISGKDYRDKDISEEGQLPKISPQIDMQTRCKHGLIQSLCQFCKDEVANRVRKLKQKVDPIIDVFEQLRYILQPPILKPSGKLTVFHSSYTPYPYQIAGVKWLISRKEALLADEMGLGKTAQAIIAMRILFRSATLQKVLVVCPASVTSSWEKEIKAWAPELRPLRIYGNIDARKEGWIAPAEINIVTYETLSRDIDTINPDKFDLCIVDEAQKIKNPKTRIHKAVASLNSTFRWAITGTPLENKIEDTKGIFSFISPGLFDNNNEITTKLLRDKIQDYTLRRTIESVTPELPPMYPQTHWLELTPAQRIAYDEVKKTGVRDIKNLGSSASSTHILALITKLKRICNFDERSGESCKLDFLENELGNLNGKNEKALIFSQYPKITLTRIKTELSEFNPLLYDGSLTQNKRDKTIELFEQDDSHQIMLISSGAGGTGLTLTRANHVFHYDHWWNPAVIAQATGRIRRLSQKRSMFVHSLFVSNSIEERIDKLLNEKRGLFNDVFGDLTELNDENVGRKLTEADLFGLFDLEVPTKSSEQKRLVMDKAVKLSDMKKMDPYDFEKMIHTLFESYDGGYNLNVTKASRDGGIDLDGQRIGLGTNRVIVQCKRYKDTVSVREVRDLFGVVSSDNNISEGFLVTTGKFSKDSRLFVKDKRITLIDGIYLEHLFKNSLINIEAKKLSKTA